jgi:uracil-DNA glycosylase
MALTQLLREIFACRTCAEKLPLGPRPVLQVAASARVLIISQAPGRKVHHSGIPWSDESGERLRTWMGISAPVFYDKSTVAIVPMGFCYPGSAGRGGDNPPRPECATLWHDRLLHYLPDLDLTLLVGQYAHRRYLGPHRKASLTETVKAFAQYGPQLFPLPHPSWRSAIWSRRHPWFEMSVVPALQIAVRNALPENRSGP